MGKSDPLNTEALSHPAGVGRMTWLIDFAGYSLSNAPPVRMSVQTTSILQNHYPERLGLAVCYHPPIIFQITWKVKPPSGSVSAILVACMYALAGIQFFDGFF